MKNLLITLAIILATIGATSCIEDGYVTDPSAQPTFSVDTLYMGTFFTEDVTPTFSFVVYNRHDKILNIDEIGLRDGGIGMFRLNVDGISGREFRNIDIRPNDSIFVFVEATIPLNGNADPRDCIDYLDFTTKGQTRTVVISALGQDVKRRRAIVIERDTTWRAEYPYQIYDSLVVAEGAKLTLEAGVKLHFHDKALLKVRGTLEANGDPERPVEMMGDRTDNVVGSIPFDLMASQWYGVFFTSTSHSNKLKHTVIRNTVYGVTVDSLYRGTPENPGLTLINCKLRNSAGYGLTAFHSAVKAVGCEFAEAAEGVLFLHGGNLVFNHCTIANYYLFSAIGGESVIFSHFSQDTADTSGLPLMQADFTNCIIYGLGTDLSCGDFTGTAVTLRRCLLKSEGTDDDNFIACLWNSDPLYYTVREDYIFDYRVKPESPAIGAANPELTLPEALTDYYGLQRGATPDLGAYVYVEPEESTTTE